MTYLQLAENVWDAAKGRSQASIVHNCGRGDDPEVLERLRRLAKSILRRCSAEELVAVGGEWRLICAWPYGDLYVLEAIWKRRGRRGAGTAHSHGAGWRVYFTQRDMHVIVLLAGGAKRTQKADIKRAEALAAVLD